MTARSASRSSIGGTVRVQFVNDEVEVPACSVGDMKEELYSRKEELYARTRVRLFQGDRELEDHEVVSALSARQEPVQGVWFEVKDDLLPFLAVGRIRDAATLALHSSGDEASTAAQLDVFTKLLAAAAVKLQAGQRTSLQWNDGMVCCLKDQQGAMLYAVVTTTIKYPERLAYQLLYDLGQAVAQVEGVDTVEASNERPLDNILGEKMRELASQFQDAKNYPQLALVSGEGSSSQSTLGASHANSSSFTSTAEEPQRRRRMVIYGAVGVVLCVVVMPLMLALLWPVPATTAVAAPAVTPAEVLRAAARPASIRFL